MITKRYPFRMGLRWVFLCLLLTALHTQAAKPYDTSNITLHVTNQPIENIFKLIEKQTGLTFYYGASILDGSKKASIRVEKASLAEVMNLLLKGKSVNWRVKDNGIVLSKATAPITSSLVTEAVADSVPLINVSGTVTDRKGAPLAGVSVSQKGFTRGQGTDQNGGFRFVGIPANAVLVFSSIGFDPKQVRVGGKSVLQVMLDSSIREIKAVEVVSTGYQSLPRERVTGSFTFLDNAQLNRTVSTSIMDRIKNITSGLLYNPTATAGQDITIRGVSTFQANTRPLIVVDGFPYFEGNEVENRGTLYADINPNDVESITVLKDAAAASIWGARAGNGVIVITTKKGRANQRVNVNLTSSLNFFERPRINDLKIMSSSEMIEYEKRVFATGAFDSYNGPFSPFYDYPKVPTSIEILLALQRSEITQGQADAQLARLAAHDIRDDINKYILRTGFNQQYSLNVSGGTEKSTYYASIGYDKNVSSLVGNNSERTTIALRNTFRPIKKLEISTALSFANSKNENNALGFDGLIADGRFKTAGPYDFIADESGRPLHIGGQSVTMRSAYIDTIQTNGLLDWHYRPIDEIANSDKTSKFFNTRAQAGIRYDIIDGLSINVIGQYAWITSRSRNAYSTKTYDARNLINRFMQLDAMGRPSYPIPKAGFLSMAETEQRTWDLRGQLSFNKTWGEHSVNAIAGMDAREASYEYSSSTKYGFDENTYNFTSKIDYVSFFPTRPGGGSGQISEGSGLGSTLNRFRSYYANVGYTWKNKYTATGSARTDASNFFGVKANLRNVPLWSAGLAWSLSEEDFYHVGVIPRLRLRATYGFNGNLDNASTSLPTILYQQGLNPYNMSLPIAQIMTPANPGLTWEKVKVINFATDFSLKNNRISGSIEYYIKNGMDLIMDVNTESTTGKYSYKGNFGAINAKGLDLSLNFKVIDKAFKWTINLLYSTNKEKVKRLDFPAGILEAKDNYLRGSSVAIPGMPLNSVYSYKWAGLDPKTGDPRGYVADTIAGYDVVLSGTNTKPSDLRFHGSSVPKHFGALINTFEYKNITLSFNINYRFGYYFRRNSINYSNLRENFGGHSDYSLRWQKPGDENITNVPSDPMIIGGNQYSFVGLSEIMVEKGDHIRLRDIRIGYTLDAALARRLNITSANLFVNANDLGILWRANKQGIDPESPNIPLSRNLAIGFNIGF